MLRRRWQEASIGDDHVPRIIILRIEEGLVGIDLNDDLALLGLSNLFSAGTEAQGEERAEREE